MTTVIAASIAAVVAILGWFIGSYLIALRQVVYEGLREDKRAAEVRRAVPYPKPLEPARPASRSRRPRVR